MDLELMTVPSSVMTPAQAAEVVDLCSEVFQLDYAWFMNLDLDRVHVLGYVGGRLMSHALWLARRMRVGAGPWLDAAYVEGVATHADHRGRGYGSALMRRMQLEIAGLDLGALATGRPGWYERLGWVRWQGTLWIWKDGEVRETPDDGVMVYRTARTGDVDVRLPLTAEWRPFAPW